MSTKCAYWECRAEVDPALLYCSEGCQHLDQLRYGTGDSDYGMARTPRQMVRDWCVEFRQFLGTWEEWCQLGRQLRYPLSVWLLWYGILQLAEELYPVLYRVALVTLLGGIDA